MSSVLSKFSIIESSSYFELAGHRLEKENHGAPQCSDIARNENEASRTKPQAWSKEIDGVEHWFYNYIGACAEAKFLGKEVPTIEQWMEMLESVPGNVVEKAEALNIPLAGCRNAFNGEFIDADVYADCWSSSPKSAEVAHCAVLDRGDSGAFRGWNSREHGLSLRFLSNCEINE